MPINTACMRYTDTIGLPYNFEVLGSNLSSSFNVWRSCLRFELWASFGYAIAWVKWKKKKTLRVSKESRGWINDSTGQTVKNKNKTTTQNVNNCKSCCRPQLTLTRNSEPPGHIPDTQILQACTVITFDKSGLFIYTRCYFSLLKRLNKGDCDG